MKTLCVCLFHLSHLTGKLKNSKVKTGNVEVTEVAQDERSGAVDQIKKKYGFSSSGVSHDAIAIYIKRKELSRFCVTNAGGRCCKHGKEQAE